MASTAPPQQQPARKKPFHQSPLTKIWLLCYNFNNALLWAIILGRVVLNATLHGFESVHPVVGDFIHFVQSIALLEILHILLGTSISPNNTNAPQRLHIHTPVHEKKHGSIY